MKLWRSFFTDFNRNRAVDFANKSSRNDSLPLVASCSKTSGSCSYTVSVTVTAVFLRHSEINQVPAAIATSETWNGGVSYCIEIIIPLWKRRVIFWCAAGSVRGRLSSHHAEDKLTCLPTVHLGWEALIIKYESQSTLRFNSSIIELIVFVNFSKLNVYKLFIYMIYINVLW